MSVTEDLLEERGYSVTSLMLSGETVLNKVFTSLIIADWMALKMANDKGSDPEEVPMIEEFKEKLRS